MALFKKNTKKTDAVVDTKKKSGSASKKKNESVSTVNVQTTGTKAGAAFRVLLKPIMSEKAALLESHRSYTFRVTSTATKDEIKRAVFQVYGVMPTGVHTLHVQGKHVRFGSYSGKRTDSKKAIVTLKKGDSIRIHEGV